MICVFVPSPMPDVARAQVYVPDAIVALARAKSAWNRTQMLDAIRSTETFLDAVKVALGVAGGAVPTWVDRVSGNFDNNDALRAMKAEIADLRRALAAAPLPKVQSEAARDVLAERLRQVEQLDRLPEYDDESKCGEIAAYAAYYAMPEAARDWPATDTGYGDTFGEAIIPADWTRPKPCDRRRELVKAGALILAEIERLDRVSKKGGAA